MKANHGKKTSVVQHVTNRFEQGITARFTTPAGQSADQERLTEVFAASQVHDPNRVTGVFSEQPPDFLNLLGLPQGTLVDDCYQVEDGPLGGVSGEAEIYRCLDSSTGGQVILKFYRIRMRPKQGVMERLCGLRHPDIVSVLNFGLWMDRFYEVMEYCGGGTLMDDLPANEDDLRRLLPEMVNGLQFLHDQGIIHRDIKPNNIYFRRPGRQDLVIGDFGISSLMADDESEGAVRFTASYANSTIDYAPPEQVFKGEISRKTDYYGLGITFLHALLGCSPFHGMDLRAITGALYSGPRTIPPQVSEEMRQLITGLTQHEVTNRWGYTQVWQWLHGERIMADSGIVWREGQLNHRRDPYPRCKQATTPKELASLLDQFDAEGDLFRSYIRRWVFDFDPTAADRIESIEDNYEDNPQLALAKLAFLLDPSLPLILANGRPAASIEELIGLLNSDFDPTLRKALVDAFASERLECWLEETQEVNDKEKLLANLAALRLRLATREQDDAFALFALLYTLAPQTPLVLRDGIAVFTLEDLETAIDQDPGLEAIVTELLFDGRLEEWLLASFPERLDDLDFLKKCPQRHGKDRRLALWSLRWRIRPSLPFPFGKESAAEPRELAVLIDRNAQTTALGLELLQNGWIQVWLETTGRLHDVKGFVSLIKDARLSWSARLEAVLHLLDPALPWPKPVVDHPTLAGGGISGEAFKTMALTVSNVGRGFLTGLITLSGENGITLLTADTKIEGRPVTVEVRLSAIGLPLGARPKAVITVQTPGGNLTVPVTFRVKAPLLGMIGRSLSWGLVWGGVLGFFRWVFGRAVPDFGSQVMSTLSWGQIDTIQGNNLLKFSVFGLMLAAILGGAGYYLVRMLNR